MLHTMVQRDPSALVAIDAGFGNPKHVSRGNLWQRVCALSSELASIGVTKEDCLAVWLPNWSDSLVWQFAAAMRGAHVIGINTRYNIEEVAHVLNCALPVVLAIAHDFVDLDLQARLRPAMPLSKARPPSVAVVSGPWGIELDEATLKRYDVGNGAWAPAKDRSAQRIELGGDSEFPDAIAVAFTTSGSTGQPKLAAHTSKAVALHALATAQAGGWQASDVTLCVLPLSGVFGYVTAMAAIASGGVCLLQPIFRPEETIADMARFGVTHVVAADDIVGRLAEAWRARPTAMQGWRRLLIADFNGKSSQLAAWAEHQFDLKASGVYGSSELFALTSLWPAEVPSPHRWQAGGLPVSQAIEVRCADSETGEAVAAGSQGELQFRGPNVVDAYLGRPEVLEKQLTTDGWFRSGDLGIVHQDGSFVYICRIGDALRLKGFLVEPAEIEIRLASHDAVNLVKVVGLKLPDGQTEAVAFVVLEAGAHTTSAQLQTWCAEGLARYKVPRAVHIIDAMPTTTGVNGTKMRIVDLRLWAQERESAKRSTPV
jgi:fatty-acyl-CoA synthase